MPSKITHAQFLNIFGSLKGLPTGTVPGAVGGATNPATDRLDMPDELLGTILAVQDKQTFIDAYGVNIPTPTEITTGSVTLKKSIGGNKLQNKTALGQGTLTTGNSGAFEYITAYLSTPVIVKDGFAEADLQQGFENAMAVKFTEALDDIEEFRELSAHVALASLNAGVGITSIDDARNNTATVDQLIQVKGAIVAEAIKLKNKYDTAKGIRRVPMQDIFIDLDETLFNNLYDTRLIQDKSDIVWRGGAWTVGTMGGFKVRPNRYITPTAATIDATGVNKALISTAGSLTHMNAYYEIKNGIGSSHTGVTYTDGLYDAAGKPVYGLIATPYTAKAYRRLVALNAGNMDNLSNDKGYYVEVRFTGDAQGNFQGITPYFDELIVPLIAK